MSLLVYEDCASDSIFEVAWSEGSTARQHGASSYKSGGFVLLGMQDAIFPNLLSADPLGERREVSVDNRSSCSLLN